VRSAIPPERGGQYEGITRIWGLLDPDDPDDPDAGILVQEVCDLCRAGLPAGLVTGLAWPRTKGKSPGVNPAPAAESARTASPHNKNLGCVVHQDVATLVRASGHSCCRAYSPVMLPDVSEKISYDCIFPRSRRPTKNVVAPSRSATVMPTWSKRRRCDPGAVSSSRLATSAPASARRGGRASRPSRMPVPTPAGLAVSPAWPGRGVRPPGGRCAGSR
jgi:hypothetical protein